MSDMEYHKGTLKKKFDKKVSFKEGIKILEKEYDFSSSHIDIDDEFIYDDEVFWINKEFYIIDNHIRFDPDSICDYKINDDGSMDFMLSFYNGGGDLNSVLQEMLNNKEKN